MTRDYEGFHRHHHHHHHEHDDGHASDGNGHACKPGWTIDVGITVTKLDKVRAPAWRIESLQRLGLAPDFSEINYWRLTA